MSKMFFKKGHIFPRLKGLLDVRNYGEKEIPPIKKSSNFRSPETKRITRIIFFNSNYKN